MTLDITRGWHLFFFLVACSHAYIMPWKPEQYPHPDLDARVCRTEYHRFCDPDQVLMESEIQSIESYLRKDRRLACQDDMYEVQFGVAIVKQMELSGSSERKEAESFARTIHDSWGIGQQTSCGDTGALLFLSEHDRTLYISRGSALDTYLTNARIQKIVAAMRPSLRKQQYGLAIMEGLRQMDYWIEQGPAIEDESNNGWFPVLIVVAFVAVFVGVVIYAAREQKRERENYARVQYHLSELDQQQQQQQAQAKQGHYHTTSCPICLDDFQKTYTHPMIGSDGLPVRLLRCSHVFDESCWKDWTTTRGVSSGLTCPICRESVSRPSLHDDDTERQELLRNRDRWEDEVRQRRYREERNFRLHRLQSRYPRHIRPSLLHAWTSAQYSGLLAQDPAFVRLDPRLRETSNTTTSSHSSGFGGGRSSGGGGGKW